MSTTEAMDTTNAIDDKDVMDTTADEALLLEFEQGKEGTDADDEFLDAETGDAKAGGSRDAKAGGSADAKAGKPGGEEWEEASGPKRKKRADMTAEERAEDNERKKVH